MGLQYFIDCAPESIGCYRKERPREEEPNNRRYFKYRAIKALGGDFFEPPRDIFDHILSYDVIDKQVDHDPNQKFEPSEALVSLMKNKAIELDKQTSDKLEELDDYFYENDAETDMDSDSLKYQISKRIEGLFSILARYNEGDKKHIIISESGMLTNNFREDVQKWLDLDNYNLKEMWDLLYEELFTFASSPRDRVWGKITKDNGNIKLLIDPKEEFKIINPKEIDSSA